MTNKNNGDIINEVRYLREEKIMQPQLVMYWKNDGKAAPDFKVPENCSIVNYTELDGAMEKWLDIVQYGLSEGKKGEEYYHECMTALPAYEEDKCFFILEAGVAVATITVVCDYEKKEGIVHMVACHESARGKGYGTLLTMIALSVLKKEGMEKARLKTDDWRVPAIKTYLRIGFEPDLSTEDYVERWNKIYEVIGKK